MAIASTFPRLAVEYLPIEAVTLDAENPRRHSPAQIRQIAASIDAFAFNAPILVDRSGRVIAGHGRVLAMKRLGRVEIPVIRLEHLSPEQARAFAIADNRLVETSSWDETLLARHFKTLAGLDLSFDLEATGFAVGEIDLMIEGLEVAPAADDPDDDPVPPGPPVARAADLWRLGRHVIVGADALDPSSYVRLLGEERVAMVLADPPYNVAINGHVSVGGKIAQREFAMASGEMSEVEFTAFLTAACERMAAVCAPGALCFLFMDWAHIFNLLTAGIAVFADLVNICVWAKSPPGMGGLYRSAHEMIAVFQASPGRHRNNVELGRYGRSRSNVWAYPSGRNFGRGEEADLTRWHPTPKPVQMLADAILDVTARGELVLDPFLGSGSTLIAAERVGRVARGLELDPLYVDLTIRRWMRLTGEDAVREDGARFSVLEAAASESDA